MRRKPSARANLLRSFCREFLSGSWPSKAKGRAAGPWIGPTVEETLTAIAGEGVKILLLQPIGFLCDHVEILYDVDIAFKGDMHQKLGVRLERPESLNASPILARALAGAC